MSEGSRILADALSPEALKRAERLDELEGIFSFNRRNFLATVLADDDVETLCRLSRQGLSNNTVRALASDLVYLETWCLMSTGDALSWPAPEALLLQFVAHHRRRDGGKAKASELSMPAQVQQGMQSRGLLRGATGHSSATVRRRLTSWRSLAKARGLALGSWSSVIKDVLQSTRQASAVSEGTRAVTSDVLQKLLATCNTNLLHDIRDRALLLTAFASGGRRRAELVNLQVEDLLDGEPLDDAGDASSPQPCMIIRLKPSGANSSKQGEVRMVGYPVVALKQWLADSGIHSGSVFRRIDQWGNVDWRALTPQSVGLILKTRCRKAGVDPAKISSQSLRLGYVLEASQLGIPLSEIMHQAQLRSRPRLP
ncbi:integrase [Rhizobium deserti]|nr:integrase [Rhizobium deserti]